MPSAPICKPPKVVSAIEAQAIFERAWTREKRLADPGGALPDYHRAAALATTNAEYWYSLASAAYAARDCDSLTASRHYVALCRQGRCDGQNPKRLQWAIKQTQFERYAQMCPKEFAAPDVLATRT